MKNEDLIIAVEQFKNGLVSHATGGSITDSEYKQGREILLKNEKVKNSLPMYVKTCRAPNEFWSFIKGKFSTYQERRDFLIEDFNTIIYSLEYDEETSLVNDDSYKLGDRLGNGGFGEVYKFHHKLLDLDFAVKILDPLFADNEKNSENCQRFFREAKMLFSLDHPNIVKFYDLGYYKGKPFMRMELINGYDMNDFVAKYSIVNFERSKKPIIALLEGLSYAHSKGIIHRDLKPSNFMVTQEGKFKIIDFGISAYSENSGHTKLTKTGNCVAGGLFTDPCLIQNPKLRDIRSDIYSVGAIWYFLLTGKAPSGADMENYLLSSSSLSKLQADVVIKCLSLDITKRYLTCKELLDILKPKEATKTTQNILGNRVTEVTRQDLFDFLEQYYNEQMEHYYYQVPSDDSHYDCVFTYCGRKTAVDFLNRIYKLVEMPSRENSFKNFEEEVIFHTQTNPINFSAWWVLQDDRLNLKNGNDEILLKFLAETFHPAVRKKDSNWKYVLDQINHLLKADGYEIYEISKISNHSVYSYRFIV